MITLRGRCTPARMSKVDRLEDMSGFKTPTAMSPPKVQAKSPLIRSSSDMTPADSQSFGQHSSSYAYSAIPGLMQAFEELKSPILGQTGTMVPRLPPIIHNRASSERGRTGNPTTSVTVSTPKASEGDITISLEALDGGSPGVSCPSPSTRRSSDGVEYDWPDTTPHRTSGTQEPGSPMKHSATALGSPFKAYGHISDSVGRDSPYRRVPPQSPTSPELEIYRRHESNGRLMVCEAREEHCSNTVTNFVGELTGLINMADLKAELMRILGELGQSGRERAKADLKVVTVGPLATNRPV